MRTFGQEGEAEHWRTCWEVHENCALLAAVSYLGARIEHDKARIKLYRHALSDPAVDLDVRLLAVGYAQRLLENNERRNWTREQSA